MDENLPKLMTDTKPQTQESQRSLSRINLYTKEKRKEENTLQHIIANLWKTKGKDKILKAKRKRQIAYKRTKNYCQIHIGNHITMTFRRS